MTALERLVEQPLGARLAELATPLASKADDERAWQDARADGGPTSSEIHRIMQSRAAWRPLLLDKLNGARFKGNAATQAGHRFEPFLIREAAFLRGTAIVGNDHAFASLADPRHIGTPDGFESDGDVLRTLEVKIHEHGWKRPKSGIPAEHYTQVQDILALFGLDEAVYVVGVLDESGELPIDVDPEIIVIPRDEQRIAEAADARRRWLEWADAGAPEDEISDELREVRTTLLLKDAALKAATDEQKAARAAFEKRVEQEHPGAKSTGWSFGDDLGTTTLAKPAKRTALDETAWAAADPDEHAEVVALRGRLAALETAARDRFTTTSYASAALRITHPKAKA
ncbi:MULTISPECIES: YqaJ viral recombinase family protein [unclassified Agrococcus]|uniref:YqaJ viral recombinase family protein n=1 Tax=unclassified Agrococcus TaxID=2615065 RepID=UPI00360B573F